MPALAALRKLQTPLKGFRKKEAPRRQHEATMRYVRGIFLATEMKVATESFREGGTFCPETEPVHHTTNLAGARAPLGSVPGKNTHLATRPCDGGKGKTGKN